MIRENKAELIIEYALVIGIVAGALLATQTYMKRGIQGIIKTTADQLAAPAEQYSQIKLRDNPSEDSQLLGAWEKGLVNYTVKEKPTVTAEKNITLTDSPPVGINPIRVTTINKDETKMSGKWEVLYNLEQEGTFAASEKTKGSWGVGSAEAKPPATNKDY